MIPDGNVNYKVTVGMIPINTNPKNSVTNLGGRAFADR